MTTDTSTRILRIYNVYFKSNEIVDGEYGETFTDVLEYKGLSATFTADMISNLGLAFAATGNDWAANPDGSYIFDYSINAKYDSIATTAHLINYPARIHAAIIRKVG